MSSPSPSTAPGTVPGTAPNALSSPLPAPLSSQPPGPLPSQPPGPEPAPVWLQRLSLVVFVLFCFYIGGILALLPWQARYWDQNGWLMAHPAIDAMMIRGWVRGLVTGIGLVDVWIGISELIHYRDIRA